MKPVAYVLIALSPPMPALAAGPRAEPPSFSDADRAPFFADAFAQLDGDRPSAVAAAPAPAAAAGGGEAPGGEAAWGDLVPADVLEAEVKRQATALAALTRAKTAYKAGGFGEASDSLALVATLFAVIAEHPDQPRWRDAAAPLRDHFARRAGEAGAATDEAYDAARAAATELQDLVRGGRPEVAEAKAEVDWGKLAGRVTLMKRMYVAEEERLKPWSASERELRRNAAEVRHEARLLAALAEASIRPGADDHDDPAYRAHARRLQDAADRLAQAAERKDQPAASTAMGELAKTCMDCHEDYRG